MEKKIIMIKKKKKKKNILSGTKSSHCLSILLPNQVGTILEFHLYWLILIVLKDVMHTIMAWHDMPNRAMTKGTHTHTHTHTHKESLPQFRTHVRQQ
jgi:formyltetrahydrofolate hydrolase